MVEASITREEYGCLELVPKSYRVLPSLNARRKIRTTARPKPTNEGLCLVYRVYLSSMITHQALGPPAFAGVAQLAKRYHNFLNVTLWTTR